MNLFWRLLVAYGLILLAAISLLGFVLEQRVERRELQEIREKLVARALLVGAAIGDLPADRLQQRARALAGQDGEGLRVTLLDAAGRVLADSEREPEEMEDHDQRPEVLTARQGGVGSDVRLSGTVGERLMYVAVRNEKADSPVAVVRLALPVDRIQDRLADLRHVVYTTAGFAALAALVLAAYLSRIVARPLSEVTHAAEDIAEGNYGQKVYTTGGGEVARLARTFNHMSMRLAQQISQLEREQQLLRAVLGGMVEGVVALDAQQRIVFANERAARLLDFAVSGVTPAAAVGRPLWDVVRQRPLLDLVGRALAADGPQRQELNWNALASRSVTVHVARLPGDPPRGAVLVFHDTSELRRLERLRHELVANVSHELKTPLAIIKACAETLLDGAAEDPTHCRSFLQQVADQSERLDRLILDLLSLARIESGAEIFSFENVAVPEAAQHCAQKHRPRAEAKGQQMQVADGPAELWAWADEEAVGEILDNLIDNAVKYTPPGGHIGVRCWAEAGWACVEVRDDGIGIPPPDLPRVFERFYRVDKARSRELGGTGLGLSIVTHLVQAMRGTIAVESQLGKGSTFTVRLPNSGGAHAEPPGDGAAEAAPSRLPRPVA